MPIALLSVDVPLGETPGKDIVVTTPSGKQYVVFPLPGSPSTEMTVPAGHSKTT